MDTITPTNQLYFKALEWAFGEYLICETENLAIKVCYDPRIAVKVVTLGGVLYDPRGSVSGGYKKTGSIVEYYGRYIGRCKESEELEKEIGG